MLAYIFYLIIRSYMSPIHQIPPSFHDKISLYKGQKVIRTPFQGCCDIVARKILLALTIVFSCLDFFKKQTQKIRDELKEGNKITLLTKSQLKEIEGVKKADQKAVHIFKQKNAQLPEKMEIVPELKIEQPKVPNVEVDKEVKKQEEIVPEIKNILNPLLTSSEKVKHAAGEFIKILNQENPPLNQNLPDTMELFTEKEKENLKKIINSNKVEIFFDCSNVEKININQLLREPLPEIDLDPELQDLIKKIQEQKLTIKISDNEEDFSRHIMKSRNYLPANQEMKNGWLVTPLMSVLKVEDRYIFFQEKKKYFNPSQEREFLIRLLMHYQSPEATEIFKRNYLQLVSQLLNYIEKIGDCTTADRSIAFREDGKEIYVNDYNLIHHELLKIEDETEDEKLMRKAKQLFSLVTNFAPLPTLREEIFESYQRIIPGLLEVKNRQYNINPQGDPPSEKALMTNWEGNLIEGDELLKTYQTAIQFYDEHKFLTGNESVPALNLTGLDIDKHEAANYYYHVLTRDINEASDMVLTAKRRHGFHINYDKNPYPMNMVHEVFNHFKQQGIIKSWSNDYDVNKKQGKNLNIIIYQIFV